MGLINTRLHALTLILLTGLVVNLTSCGVSREAEAEAQPQPRSLRAEEQERATNVDVAIARAGSLKEDPEYIGTTAPLREVSLRSQSEGKLLRLNVDVGSLVQQGQILAQLDDTLLLTTITQAEAELASRQAEVARARTQVNNAHTKVEQARLEQQQAQNDAIRYQQLYSAGAVSRQQAELAITAAATAAQAVRVGQEQYPSRKRRRTITTSRASGAMGAR